MRLFTKKLNSYSLEQLIEGVPKLKGQLFIIRQSPDRKSNPTDYWDAMYYSDMDGGIKYSKQAETPKVAIVELIKEIRSKGK